MLNSCLYLQLPCHIPPQMRVYFYFCEFCNTYSTTNKLSQQLNLQPTASHPSVKFKGQEPQERCIGVYTGNHRRHPLPSPIFRLRSALPVTGVLAVGRGRRESILYVGAEPATRLLVGGNIQIPVLASYPGSLGEGEKRAWYLLFAHALN